MTHGRSLRTKLFAVLATLLSLPLLSPAARAQDPNDGVTPKAPITLVNGDSPQPYIRFTVGHAHLASYCWGYLDVSESEIVFHSITQPPHSFKIARAGVAAYLRFGSWVVIPTPGRNYDYILADQQDAHGAPGVRTAFDRKKNPDPILQAVNNWETYLAALRADLKAKEPPPPPLPPPPVEPPKPKIARLTVNTQPGNVEVYLDGKYQGRTSERGDLVVEAPPGDHELRLSLPNYKEWSQVVAFQADYQGRRDVTLESSGPKPLTEKDVEDALVNGLAKVRIVALVEKYGVSFALDAQVEATLRSKGADSELLLSIAKNKK